MKENDFLKSLVKEQQEDAKTRKRAGTAKKRKVKVWKKTKITWGQKSVIEVEVISLRRQVAEANELRNENEKWWIPWRCSIQRTKLNLRWPPRRRNLDLGNLSIRQPLPRLNLKQPRKSALWVVTTLFSITPSRSWAMCLRTSAKTNWEDVSESR